MLLAAVAIAGLSGCSDEEDEDTTAVVGAWQSTEDVVGVFNALSAEDGGDGHATLYILITRDGQTGAGRFEFDAEWDARRNGDIEFSMSCERSPMGPCTVEDDFEMDCELSQSDSQLSCQGSVNWREYQFSWTRQ
jgi:hypothetical protein